MTNNNYTGTAILIVLATILLSCSSINDNKRKNLVVIQADSCLLLSQEVLKNRGTFFPQIHSHLNEKVSEFVRKMHQDKKGNLWFGTNNDGVIKFDGSSLRKYSLNTTAKGAAVRGIDEDQLGNIWFATSNGLAKYNGKNFVSYTMKDSSLHNRLWAVTVDSRGKIWVGSIKGVFEFTGNSFRQLVLTKPLIEDPQPMLSHERVSKILEDTNGVLWFVVDGYGICRYDGVNFSHLTVDDGLPDNNVADLMEDDKGNIWIGSYYGGVSMYNGEEFINFTSDSIIDGAEVYNFINDSKGNVWFSAENVGVYQYNGAEFTKYTVQDGLTTNGIQCIFEDEKEQIWFCTWKGISMYNGDSIRDVKFYEPWTE